MAYDLSFFCEDHDYWLGADPESGRHLLGIPVSNPMVDYIETYWLDEKQYADFVGRPDRAAEFADACRRRECDQLLTHQPGKNRGTPR